MTENVDMSHLLFGNFRTNTHWTKNAELVEFIRSQFHYLGTISLKLLFRQFSLSFFWWQFRELRVGVPFNLFGEIILFRRAVPEWKSLLSQDSCLLCYFLSILLWCSLKYFLIILNFFLILEEGGRFFHNLFSWYFSHWRYIFVRWYFRKLVHFMIQVTVMHEVFRIYVYFLEESLVPHLRKCLKDEVTIFMLFLRFLFLG